MGAPELMSDADQFLRWGTVRKHIVAGDRMAGN